ncbi:cytochrome c biogenesis protein ResB [Desulfotomaculum sp. 1211_IL3151]|uniref:cytochrome c biogenesis protein ResB n=1 Tax=Desulfotomaculum sp. 1211_IL3151 TaxID=3084055 RepID=UPI002FDB01B5
MNKIVSAIAGTWRFLTSMSLGLALLCLLIIFSVMGTFQMGIFVSPWFLGLSALLTLNMLGCTVRRVKGLLKRDQGVPGALTHRGHHRTLILENCPPEKAIPEATSELRHLGFRVAGKKVEQGKLLIGKSKGWANLASPLLHLAMVFVIAGGVAGAVWGQELYVKVPVPGRSELSKQGFPFDINVKKFTIDQHEDGTPKQYTSLIEVSLANEKKLEKAVSVNNPLHYQGVKIYQTSYGYQLQGAIRDEKHTFNFNIEEGERILLGGPARLELEVRWPRYVVYSNGMPFSMGIAELQEPIHLMESQVVFTNRIAYTGLRVKKDPGLPLIWLGFILFLLALPVRLYVKPNQIWLLISPKTTGTEIRLAARHRLRGREQEELLIEKLSGIIREERSLHT